MSTTILGIIAAAGLPFLASWGFSEACSQEIVGIGVPQLLAVPGLVLAWWGRVRVGDVNAFGVRK